MRCVFVTLLFAVSGVQGISYSSQVLKSLAIRKLAHRLPLSINNSTFHDVSKKKTLSAHRRELSSDTVIFEDSYTCSYDQDWLDCPTTQALSYHCQSYENNPEAGVHPYTNCQGNTCSGTLSVQENSCFFDLLYEDDYDYDTDFRCSDFNDDAFYWDYGYHEDCQGVHSQLSVKTRYTCESGNRIGYEFEISVPTTSAIDNCLETYTCTGDWTSTDRFVCYGSSSPTPTSSNRISCSALKASSDYACSTGCANPVSMPNPLPDGTGTVETCIFSDECQQAKAEFSSARCDEETTSMNTPEEMNTPAEMDMTDYVDNSDTSTALRNIAIHTVCASIAVAVMIAA